MVSIIITYIDEIDFLKEALQSVYLQKTDNAQIIVVCNDPVAHHQEFSSITELPDIMWLHEPVRGSAAARNTGLHKATHDWIQFLDVDDILREGKIKNQFQNASGGAVVSPHTFRRLSGLTKKSKWQPDDIWSGLLNSGLGSTSSMLWNKEAMLKAGGWSSAYQSHQEYELLFRLLKAGHKITPVDRTETVVRERKKGSITQMTKPFRAKEGIRLREEIWTYLNENGMSTPERKNAFLQYIFRQLRGLYMTDTVAAKTLYNKYFSHGKFFPEKGNIPLYNFLYKTVGFHRTESLLHLYRNMRDRYLSFLPKNK